MTSKCCPKAKDIAKLTKLQRIYGTITNGTYTTLKDDKKVKEIKYQLMSKTKVVANKPCYRIGCNEPAETGIRNKDGTVMVFCGSCYTDLVNSGIIDPYTRKIKVS